MVNRFHSAFITLFSRDVNYYINFSRKNKFRCIKIQEQFTGCTATRDD